MVKTDQSGQDPTSPVPPVDDSAAAHRLIDAANAALQDSSKVERRFYKAVVVTTIVLVLALFGATYLVSSAAILPTGEQRRALTSLRDTSEQLQDLFVQLKAEVQKSPSENPAMEQNNADGGGGVPEPTPPTPQPSECQPPGVPCSEISQLLSTTFRALEQFSVSAYEMSKMPLPNQVALGQMAPVGLVIVLLGFLGLKRMQGYDLEIAAARTEIRDTLTVQLDAGAKHVQEQVETLRRLFETFKADTRTEQDKVFPGIDTRFKALRGEIKDRIEGMRGSLTDHSVATVHDEFQKHAKRLDEARAEAADLLTKNTEQANEVQKQLRTLIEGNPWLRDESTKDWFEKVKGLRSADEAHELATDMRAHGAQDGVRAALESVVGDADNPPLEGSADNFHNCYIEAQDLPDKPLGKRILEVGLKQHPGNVDLSADMIQVCTELGEAPPADVLEKLRETGAYWTNWRPVVFEAQALSRGGSEKEALEAIKLLEEGVNKIPRDPKIWRALADLHRRLGHEEEAERTFRRGIAQCPTSQVLSYNLGEMLLEWGRSEEALDILQQAMRHDYQRQFQPDVSQAAVMLTTAQALEACGKQKEAARLYRRVISEGTSDRLEIESVHMLKYARHRLVLMGMEEDEESGTGMTPEQALELVENKHAEMKPEQCLGVLVQIAGPPIPLERVLAALDLVRSAHELDESLYQRVRDDIRSKYPGGSGDD